MSPYCIAWERYHSYGEVGWSWDEAMSLHLQHGTVISTPDAFVMARRVHSADEDDFHLSPLQWRAAGDCWNIWAAAGRLESLLGLAQAFPTPWVSYCRRDSVRLRRYRLRRFLRHVPENPQATED